MDAYHSDGHRRTSMKPFSKILIKFAWTENQIHISHSDLELTCALVHLMHRLIVRSLLKAMADRVTGIEILDAKQHVEKEAKYQRPNGYDSLTTGQINFPSGDHRFLLRSRRAARFFIDGQLVISNPFPDKIQDGQEPVERPFIPLGPNIRFPAPGDQEALVSYKLDAGFHNFQLEFYVGGFAGKQALRPETGETLVAVALEGESNFHILSSDLSIPLTDQAWHQFRLETDTALDQIDDDRRRNLQGNKKEYWDRRHRFAKEVLKLPLERTSRSKSIDQLVLNQIQKANTSLDTSEEASFFINKIKPILKDKCLNCHGGKSKGGLRLDSRTFALNGGDSEVPAIVPHHPENSLLWELISTDDLDARMPPKGPPVSEEELAGLTQWIATGAVWPESDLTEPVTIPNKTDDLAFLRRVHLDTIGIPPTAATIQSFIEDGGPDKRRRMIDQLLENSGWADHWVSYWQDILAENPTIVNPTLNNTGPFRWWLYESFKDNKPFDRMVTELVMMEGSLHGGGPAGFGMASQNDVPMAAKANILSTAFLATEMKCSRCHDAPYHENTQENLFGMASMLARKPIKLPASSSVPLDSLHTGSRKPLIKVTLKPGTEVSPKWPFSEWQANVDINEWLLNNEDTREQLAFHLTSPFNSRFPKVIVNRLWKRLIGRGMVEPVHDWENASPSNSELLNFLSDALIQNNYDLKAVTRLILNSKTYQRKTTKNKDAIRYFAGPGPRRLSAEQIVDSLFAITGKKMKTEPLTVDIGGGRPWSNAIHLGQPRRAWMFGGLANNRDRPSLTLPRVQAVTDVLTAFGWRPSRQEPANDRSLPLNPLQPAILNNGTVTTWLTRLSEDHPLTQLALTVESAEELINQLYLQIVNRHPSTSEHALALNLIKSGFNERIVASTPSKPTRPDKPPLFVTWGNHLQPEATTIQLEATRKAKEGAPPTRRLDPDWRERMEDLTWALINLPETIHYH
jgi:hypothetical protein